jgi:8-amino-7-oxononanoate synthase
LGLANHPEVIDALSRGAQRYGAGSGSAHLVCGHFDCHQALEDELAEFTGRERGLVFSTGYMANLGVLSALADRSDTILEDRLNHASLLDGAKLSGARLRRYAHGDPRAAEDCLRAADGSCRVIATDGVFSMDGDLAPIGELAGLASRSGTWLMVDDAHGLGVLGSRGQGSLELLGLRASQVPILVGTLGKAFGSFGAFVAGSSDLIEFLIQHARTYVYTTALPPAMIEAARAALKLSVREPWRRERLTHLVGRFRSGAEQLGLPIGASLTPIQPIILGDSRVALRCAEDLLAGGMLVAAIRPPTVPKGTARLRITLSTGHTEDQVDRLLEAVAAAFRAAGCSDQEDLVEDRADILVHRP